MVFLSNFGAAGPARVDAHAKGEIICDGTGELWFCTVAGTPGTRGVDGYHVYFEVRFREAASKLDGVSLRLTIPTESTKGAVLAVPTSALALAADGTSRIQVQDKDGLKYVVVRPGLSASGYVEVTPVDATLKPGQLVVVGYKTSPLKELQ